MSIAGGLGGKPQPESAAADGDGPIGKGRGGEEEGALPGSESGASVQV